jgi:alcohol dehydrogenase (NADP+)
MYQIPEEIKSEEAGPLMCAGLTVYSPLKRNGTGPGKVSQTLTPRAIYRR